MLFLLRRKLVCLPLLLARKAASTLELSHGLSLSLSLLSTTEPGVAMSSRRHEDFQPLLIMDVPVACSACSNRDKSYLGPCCIVVPAIRSTHDIMTGRVLFVNGHIWQSEQESAPAASWLLISQGRIIAVGVGNVPTEHR